MKFWELIRLGLDDVQLAFDIKDNLFAKYVPEITQNPQLVALGTKRDNVLFDWTKETPLGGIGTTLNASVLYSLIRQFNITEVIETGVSGGYYSSFMLAALQKNSPISKLVSLEISADEKEVGKLIPQEFKKNWELHKGQSSLEIFKHWNAARHPHSAQLYSHDSLHLFSYMCSELEEFKQTTSNKFIVFIDDQKSEDFWKKALNNKLFEKTGFSVKYISGDEAVNKQLGGFLKYERVK